MSQYCKTAKHGGSLCPFPVPRNAARLMTRGGVGEVNDITGCAHIWILTQWHLVFPVTPPSTSPQSPLWSLDCAWLCLFFAPSKNTSFSLPPLKQLPAYEVEKMTLHLMMNGPWPPEPAPVGLTRSRICISHEISRTHLFTSGRNRGRSPPPRCCKWRLNICWSTSAVNWTTFTAAFSLSALASWFDTHPHWWGCLAESPFVTWLITLSNSYGGINN